MSLKSLLAVGESIFSVTQEPEPYEVRKEYQLPVFGASEVEKQTVSSLTPGSKPQKELDFERRTEPRVKIGPERREIEVEPVERRLFLDRKRRGGARNLTQEELRLEQVKVVRNDLSDADLDFAPRRSARTVEPDLNPFAPRPIAAIGRPAHEKQGWAARLARLLGLRRRGRP